MKKNKYACIIVGIFLIIWSAGTLGFLLSINYWTQPSAELTTRSYQWLESAYGSLQLFVLNFNLSSNFRIHWLLQIVRFVAPLFSAFATIWALSQPLRQLVSLRIQIYRHASSRVIIIGYGPIGQVVARKFSYASIPVTAIDCMLDNSAISQAHTDHILLIEGDGISNAIMAKTAIHRAHRVFIALSNDVTSLDAARVARAFLDVTPFKGGIPTTEIRVLLRDPEIVRKTTDESASWLRMWQRISVFALPQMAAAQLCHSARFDRMALDANQQCAHLVIFGCGVQGEAIATEFLLTAWRTCLTPPIITLCDRNCNDIRSRFRRIAPALLMQSGTKGALPTESSPHINFHTVDIESINFATDQFMLEIQKQPVTAYIISCGDDNLNVNTALSLESAMLLRRTDAAPIFVRIWNANKGEEADLGFDPTGMIYPFGSLESIIKHGLAFCDSPDQLAKYMHEQYRKIGEEMQRENSSFIFTEGNWESLKETYRVSNRRIIRHAEQKLEDLGFQWNRTSLQLPNFPSETLAESSQYLGDYILRAARVEHDRWMTDRALDGWVSAGQYDIFLRDNQKRIHHSITAWNNLDEYTQKYDTIFLRSLLTSGKEKPGSGIVPTAWPREVSYAWITACSDLKLVFSGATSIKESTTELVIGINEHKILSTVTGFEENAKNIKKLFFEKINRLHRLCRLRIMYFAPPRQYLLHFVQAVSDLAREHSIEMSISWNWRREEGLTLAFAGHRDLTLLGEATNLTQIIKASFIRLALEKNFRNLVVGYAPGADQLAVESWNELGLPKPLLIFPFMAGEKESTFSLEDTKLNEKANLFSRNDLIDVGRPIVARIQDDETPHQAQGRELLDRAEMLVVLWDKLDNGKAGGTGDTVEKAQARGIPVNILRI